jgi:hypothetical protein
MNKGLRIIDLVKRHRLKSQQSKNSPGTWDSCFSQQDTGYRKHVTSLFFLKYELSTRRFHIENETSLTFTYRTQ